MAVNLNAQAVAVSDWFVGEGGTVRGSIPSESVSALQLAAGHFIPKFFDMAVIYPRSDAETGSYAGEVNARHRWAYYDGANPIQYEVPLKVYGGAAPHWYEIISAPAGASIENVYGDPSKHSVVKWTPSQAYSTGTPATFLIRVHDQGGETIDIPWTCATSSSTDKFIFLDASAADNSGTGSISSPFKTLVHVMGTLATVETFPNRIVYLRAGTYETIPHTDGWIETGETVSDRTGINALYHPTTYLSYPNEDVEIDLWEAEIVLDDNTDDVLISGSSTNQLVFNGGATGTAEAHNFWLGTSAERWGFAFVSFDGFTPRIAGDFTNTCPIFSPHSNVNPDRQYGFFHNVGETNRVLNSENQGKVAVLFGVHNFVDEYTFGTGTAAFSFKDTCFNTSTRYGNLDAGVGNESSIQLMGQTAAANQEIVYGRYVGVMWFNLQNGPASINIKEGRNTIYTTDNNYNGGLRALKGAGTADGYDNGFESVNSAIVSSSDTQIAPLFGAVITATGTEVQANRLSADLPFNTTTLLLENNGTTQWRDLYLGTRGHEII